MGTHALAETAGTRPSRKPRTDHGWRNTFAARTDEQRLLRRRGESGAHTEPGVQGIARLGADWYGARLGAFAGHGDFAVLEVDATIGHIKSDELGEAQARRIQELEHRAIAQRRRCTALLNIEEALGCFHRQRL